MNVILTDSFAVPKPRAHDNGLTSDIPWTFTLISGQLVTWLEYMSVIPV